LASRSAFLVSESLSASTPMHMSNTDSHEQQAKLSGDFAGRGVINEGRPMQH